MALSGRQKIWLEEYLSTWNATEAARRAGYALPRQEGFRNKNVLAKEISERVSAVAMSADEALVRLSEQARAAYADYITTGDDGAPRIDMQRMLADGKGHLIKSIKPSQWGWQVEFHDAQTALLNIGRHHSLFTDKVDMSGDLELKAHESAAESILSRIAGIAERLRAQTPTAGNSANGSGADGATA